QPVVRARRHLFSHVRHRVWSARSGEVLDQPCLPQLVGAARAVGARAKYPPREFGRPTAPHWACAVRRRPEVPLAALAGEATSVTVMSSLCPYVVCILTRPEAAWCYTSAMPAKRPAVMVRLTKRDEERLVKLRRILVDLDQTAIT